VSDLANANLTTSFSDPNTPKSHQRERSWQKHGKGKSRSRKSKTKTKTNALHEKKRKGTKKTKLPTSSFNPPPTFLLVPHFSFKYVTRASSVLAPS